MSHMELILNRQFFLFMDKDLGRGESKIEKSGYMPFFKKLPFFFLKFFNCYMKGNTRAH